MPIDCIAIDLDTFSVRRATIESWKLIEGTFIRAYYTIGGKEQLGLSPAAFYYQEKHLEQVTALMAKLKAAKKAYDDLQAQVFYTELPALNAELTLKGLR